MCCFSGAVDHVADTRIFARPTANGRQLLAYQMTYSAAADVAMVLPLPVPAGSPDDALRFINLEGYPELFDSLHALFPQPRTKGLSLMRSLSVSNEPPLAVVQVGSFEASFVPALAAFSRLDARFRISDAAWKQLPQYKDWGFAVFKLKKGNQSVHPMAFEFPRRDAKQVFFPTVHIHDGQVHETAAFDHALYLQPASGQFMHDAAWRESTDLANSKLDGKRSQGLIDLNAHVYLRELRGALKNADITV
ncbi:MAG: hypothetical protein QM723_19995 [Myxococcaceae bacterium]